MSIAPGVRRYQLYLKMKDKKLLPMNRQLIPLQSSCVRKCRRQHHLLPHRQHLLRLQHRRRHLLLHRQNRQKPEVLPVFRLKVGHRVRKQAIKTLLKNPKQRQNQRQRSRLRLGRRSLRQRRNPLPSRRCKISRLIHTASIFCPETAGASTLPQHLVIFTAWARSGCAATPLLSLSGSDTSGVTITAVSTGSATVTVYSRSTGQSASCTVNVN